MRRAWIGTASALLLAAGLGAWAAGLLRSADPAEPSDAGGLHAPGSSGEGRPAAGRPALAGAARPTAALDGPLVGVRVLTADTGLPVAGAQVVWTVERASASARWRGAAEEPAARLTGVTDAAGLASTPCPRAGPVWASASADGYGGDQCAVPDGARQVVLRLVPHGVIEGRVLAAEDGRPLAGLSVTSGHLGAGEVAGVSGAEGGFRFTGVPPGTWRVNAYGAGLSSLPDGEEHVGAQVQVRAGDVTRVDLKVGPAAVVEGRVLLADGRPAAGAEVWLRHDHVAWSRQRLGGVTLHADADGRFRFDSVPLKPNPTWVDVCARAPGTGVAVVDLSGTWGALTYRVAAPATEVAAGQEAWLFARPSATESVAPVEVRLPVGGALVLEVRDADSAQPVSGATVTLSGAVPEFEGRSDARGEVRAEGLTPGRLKAWASAPGYGLVHRASAEEPSDAPILVVAPGASGRAVLHVRRTCGIGAVLQWSDGTPAEGVRMVLEVKGRQHGEHYWTDVVGSFRRDGLPWDTYDVTISPGFGSQTVLGPDGDPIVYARATLAPDTLDAVLRLSRGPVLPLRLTVLDAQGEPVPDGRVRFELATTEEEVGSGLICFEGERIQDGRAVLAGLDRPVWLEVHPGSGPGATSARTRLGPVPPGVGELTVRLMPGLTIAGRLEGPGGEPLAGIPVEAWIETSPQPEAWHNQPFAQTPSTADGTFRLEHLPAGPYTLYARVDKGFAPAPEVEVEAGRTDVVLSLVRRVSARVTVLLPDGTPSENATVTAFVPPWFGGDGAARGFCGRGGVALLKELDPRAAYLLEVSNRHPADQCRVLRFPGWTPADTTVRLPPRNRLLVRVVDDLGAPVENPAVILTSLAGVRAMSGEAVLDDPEERALVFLDPPPGPWVAVAMQGARLSAPQRIEAGAREARVVLPRTGGRLLVEVPGGVAPPAPTDPRNSWPRWMLWDEAEPSARLQGYLDAAGRVDLEGLPPDRTYACLIRDTRPGGFVALATGLSPDGSGHKAVRHDPKPQRITAVESPVAWVRSLWVSETGEAAERDDGAFRLPALPPGRYTLRAEAERRDDRATIVLTVPFDGEHVPALELPTR